MVILSVTYVFNQSVIFVFNAVMITCFYTCTRIVRKVRGHPS